MIGNSHSHSRIGSISNHRLNIGSVVTNLFIEHCIFIALQRFPVCESLVPFSPLRCILTSLDIFESYFIGSYHTSTCSHFDTQVTQSKTSFHGQAANSFSCIFHKISGCTACCHFRHHIKCHILGCHTFAQFSVDGNTHGLGASLKNTLRSHYHFYFTGSDTESNCSHRSVSRRM